MKKNQSILQIKLTDFSDLTGTQDDLEEPFNSDNGINDRDYDSAQAVGNTSEEQEKYTSRMS